MFCLRWRWDDGNEGFCVGNLDSLSTVKIAIGIMYPQILFSLKNVNHGQQVPCLWLREDEMIDPKFGG